MQIHMELNKNQKRLSLGGARLLLYKRVFSIGGTAIRIGLCTICHHRQGNVGYTNLYSLLSYIKEEFPAHRISSSANLLANNIFVQQKNSFILV